MTTDEEKFIKSYRNFDLSFVNQIVRPVLRFNRSWMKISFILHRCEGILIETLAYSRGSSSMEFSIKIILFNTVLYNNLL
jgi:uncharacterized membrane protein